MRLSRSDCTRPARSSVARWCDMVEGGTSQCSAMAPGIIPAGPALSGIRIAE